MKIVTFCFTALIFLLTDLTFAQTKSFDDMITPWHKKAIMTCGMLRKMDSFDPAKFMKNLDELEAELKTVSDQYMDNPPAEYAKDPLWKTYLEDLADNIVVIRERMEKKQYRLAQKYCPNFCMIVGKMHRNNGRTDLTDVMFSWRAEIRNAMDMANAGNTEGAKNHLEMVDRMYNKVKIYQKKKNDAAFDALFAPVEQLTKDWQEALKNGDKEKMKAAFDSFMNEFSKPYLQTL